MTLELPVMVSLKQVADSLGVTVTTIRGWDNFPRCHYYGGRWNVDLDAVMKWLDDLPGDKERDALRHDVRDHHATPESRREQAIKNLQRRSPDAQIWAP